MQNNDCVENRMNDAAAHGEFIWAIVTLFLIVDAAIVLFVVL